MPIPLTPRDERKLRMFGNKLIRKIFVPKKMKWTKGIIYDSGERRI
jgi:hypothetical protein